MARTGIVHKLSDGTFLVAAEGDNIHLNHWHVAPDGTLLSVKEGGSHLYKRSDVRRHIDDVIADANGGVRLKHGWSSPREPYVPKPEYEEHDNSYFGEE